MSHLIQRRGIWAPLLIVTAAWLVAGFLLRQESLTTASARPDQTPPRLEGAAIRPVAAVAAGRAESEPVVLAAAAPSAPIASPLDTSAEAQQRLARFQELRDEARQAQLAAADAAQGQPEPQPAPHPGDADEQESQPPAAQPPRSDAAAAQEKPASQPTTQPAGSQPASQPQVSPEEVKEKLRRLKELRERAARSAAERAAQSQPARPDEPAVEDDGDLRSAPRGPDLTAQPADRPMPQATTAPDTQEQPPADAEAVPPPADDGRTEWFSYDEMPFEDVVRQFADRLGKPIIGDVLVGGSLTYKGRTKMTKEEAIDRLNLLMQMQAPGYRFVEIEDYVMVIPINEMAMYVPIDYIFATVEEFEAASPRDMEYVTVYIRIEDRAAADVVNTFASGFPDYVRMTSLDDTNQIKFTALAKDVRKFLTLFRRLPVDTFDPRQMKIFEIKTNATVIEDYVRNLLGVQPPRRQYNPQTRQIEMVGGDENIFIMADERTNTLIVKATPDQLKQVEKFLAELDKKPDIGEFKTNVIAIKHGNAREIADLLNQIFQQEQGEQSFQQRFRQPIRPNVRNRNVRQPQQQPGQVDPGDVFVEDIFERAKKTIRLSADERTNTLIVYANEDGLKRVEEMLEHIDRPVPSNFRTFVLQNAEAEQMQPTIEQIARSIVTQVGGRGATRAPSVIADPAANALHVIAEREAMTEIEEIIGQLDVPGAQQNRHVVELVNMRPSEMAGIVESLLQSSEAGPTRGRRPPSRFQRGGPTTVVGSQVIGLDNAGLLIVICTDEEWSKIEETIRNWDERAATNRPRLQEFLVERGDVQSIFNTVSQLYSRYQHPTFGQSAPGITMDGQKIYVYAIEPAIAEIGALVKAMDVEPTVYPMVIIPLQHADAATVVEQLQPIITGGSTTFRGRTFRGVQQSGGVQPSVQADAATNSLIVRADEDTLEQIKQFVDAMEQAYASQAPERRFYALKYADPRDVIGTLTTLFNAGGGGGRFGGQRVGTQVKAVTAGTQLVVEAPADRFGEIERVIEQLDDPRGRDVVIKSIQMRGAEVASIASRLTAAFQTKLRTQGLTARFDADPATESILLTVSSEVLPEAESLLKEYGQFSAENIIDTQFRQLQHATAQEAAQWLQPTLAAALEGQSRTMARQIKVTPDPRTNRVIVSGPTIAVKQGLQLLEQYDEPTTILEQQGVVPVTETRKLPGLDVANLANQLNQAFRPRPPRPDKLGYTFGYDQLTNILIFTVPPDEVKAVDEIIAKFAAETEDVTPVEKFFEMQFAEAQYVADHLKNLLMSRIVRTRGRDVADRVNITVDTRLNRVVMFAPRFAIEMAEALIKELDQAAEGPELIQTIALQNADANVVSTVLNDVLREKFRTNRNLRISVEPLTNALIVAGSSKSDFEEIKQWATGLDEQALSSASPPRVFPLKNANAGEVVNVLNTFFLPRRTGVKSAASQEIAFSQVGGANVIVQAPREKLEQIEALITELDSVDTSALDVRTYQLKVLDAMQVAMQVNIALSQMGGVTRSGQMRPGAFGESTTNTLVVLAPRDRMEMIDLLIKQLESFQLPEAETRAYTLANARADQVAANLDQMLKAKVREKEGARKQSLIQTAVFSDVPSNRLIVFAPPDYQELASELVRMIDKEPEAGEIVRIVQLTQGDAAALAQTLTQTIQGAGPRGGRQVKVVADAGSNALLISGLGKDVAWVEGMIGELEKSQETPEVQVFQLEYASTIDVVAALTGMFPPARTPSDTVTVTEDDYYNRLIVTANKRRMRQVEAVIELLDAAPEGGLLAGPGGKNIYFVDVYRGDPYDIAWDVEELFPPPDKGGPTIESAWDGDYIKVICRESEFPAIKKAIEEYDARSKPITKYKIIKPKGDLEKILQLLPSQVENVVIKKAAPADKPRSNILIDLWADDEAPAGAKPRPAVPEREERGADRRDGPARPRESNAKDDKPARRADAAWPGLRVALASMQDSSDYQNGRREAVAAAAMQLAAHQAADQRAEEDDGRPKRQPANITILPDGRMIVVGPESAVTDIEDAVELLEEDLATGQVIRIFRFKYGDVSSAAQILERMFNDPVARIPQMPQQPQQPQQRGRGGRGEGEEGEGGRGGQQGGLMDQIRNMMGQARGGQQGGAAGGERSGGQRVRIAVDGGHNRMVVKCDEADLPEIIELLRELDIPPSEVDIRVFQLRNLDAQETAENIKQVLGIARAQSRRQPFGGNLPRGGQQQQLMEILQQQLAVAFPGGDGEGAKIESVEIVPNQITNSLLVSAPPEVMDIIEGVIGDLEQLEGRDVLTIAHFKVDNAKVDDILPLLQAVFEPAGARGGGGGPGGRGGSKPADIGPVSITGDPRANTIIVTAMAKDIPIVEEQIRRLDIEGPIAEAEFYVCRYGDAPAIADAVSQIYGPDAAPGGRPGRGGQGAGSPDQQVRITAEPATNTIIVFAPEEKRTEIFAKIKELDELNPHEIREITVAFADPEKLAEKLMSVFGGRAVTAAPSGGPRGRRGAPGAGASLSERIVVIGDKAAGKLLVRAPDVIFEQMVELVATLDVQSEQLQIRTFKLDYADATVVVDSVKSAMMEYMMVMGQTGNEPDFDPFTAVPDPRTNSVIVVGSPQTFVFVDSILAAVDMPTPDEQRRQFKVYVLYDNDAQQLADLINSMSASGGGAQGGGAAPGGRRGGGRMPFGGAGSSGGGMGAEFNVVAAADVRSNTLMVFGRPEDLKRIEEQIINPVEAANTRRVAQIVVQNVPASQVASRVLQFWGDAGEGASRPNIQPNDNGKMLVVWGTESEIQRAQMLAQAFDDPNAQLNPIKVIPIPMTQDATVLARELERIVGEHERAVAQAESRTPRLITIGADAGSNAIIVNGDPTMFSMVEGVVQQLGDIRPGRMVTKVIQLNNLSAEDARMLIEDIQNRRGGAGGTGGSGGLRGPTPGGTFQPGFQPGQGGFNRGGFNRGGGTGPGQRNQQQPPRRGGNPPQQPRGSGMLWPAGLPGGDIELDSPGPSRPIVTTALVSPLVLTLLTQDAPPAEQPAAAPAETQPAGPGVDQAVIDSISGELRGPIYTTPLGSKQIIVTGDETDVDFIVQMLALMEQTAPRPTVRVFTLENAKAVALQQPLQQIVQELVRQRTAQPRAADGVSIIAEARSNSLIVAASEENMELIANIIDQLDKGADFATFDVKVLALDHIQAAEAVGILSQSIERLNQVRGNPPDAQAAVFAIDRGNSVQIIGTARDIEEIERLVKSIDIPLDPDQERSQFSVAEVLVLNLQNAIAEDVAAVLQEVIDAERSAGTGGGGAAPQGRRPAAALIRQLQLTTGDGRQLPPLDLDKPIVVKPEKGTNSLLIYSNRKNNEALREIVHLFDSLPQGAEVDVRAITLKYANAQSVAELLQRMFDEGKASLKRPAEGDGADFPDGVMPPVPPGGAGRGLPYNVTVTHDARSNTVLVIGRKDAVILAGALATQLDVPSADLALKPYVVPLKNKQATELRDSLTELLEQRIASIGGDQENLARDSAVIVADDRSNSLLVLASDEVYALITEIAAKVDTAASYRIIETRFRRLEYADAAKLQGLLQELFDRKKEQETEVSEVKDQADILADTRSNGLLLVGTRDYLDEAEDLIEGLDQSFEPTAEFKVRPVLFNSAVSIASMLTEMIENVRGQQDEAMRGTPIHVAADPYSNNLLLAAASEDMLMLERWIEVLDRPAEPGRMMEIIPIRTQKAEELAQQMQEAFQTSTAGGGQGGGGAGADLTVWHDNVTNSVVVVGPPTVVRDIKDLLQRLDEVTPTAMTVVKHFKLEQADAEDAGELLRSIIAGEGRSVGGGAGGGGGGTAAQQDSVRQVMLIYQQKSDSGMQPLRGLRDEIVVIDDLRTNSLYVLAPINSMPLVESLVAAIDIPPDAARIKVFPLRNSTAEEIVTMLEELFEGGAAGPGGRTGGGAAGDEQERILTVGEGLAEGGRQQISFTTDLRTNSVIAAGTRGYLDLVEQLILELDTKPIEDRKTIVYEPKNTPADALTTMITEYNDREQQRLGELEEEISASRRREREILAVTSEDVNRVIIDYDPRREADVLRLVQELDQQPAQVMIQVLIIEVTLENTLELGVEFAFQDLQFAKAGPSDTTTFDYVGGTDIGAAGSGLGGFTFTITGADFNFLLRTLQSESRLNVLSRPQIIAMDNQLARIDVSNDVPYVTSSSTSDAGQVTTQVAREQIGIQLEVTPFINPDGFVRMELKQTVSDLTDSTVAVGPGVTAPVFFRREAETVVTVRDNETVVLGGLITSREGVTEQKIPLLGDIPLLGTLFRYTNREDRRSELLLVLTPRVIRAVEDYRELSIRERDATGYIPDEVRAHPLMHKLQVKPEDLIPDEGREMFGPFNNGGETVPINGEPYGPPPPAAPNSDPRRGDPASYDVPITRKFQPSKN